jgi:phosphatidylserine decarboxylase
MDALKDFLMAQPRQHFVLSIYGWTYWLPILLAGGLLVAVLLVIPGGWPWAMLVAVVALAWLAFFRDFPRVIPSEPGIMVAPADGKITDISRIEHVAALGGPALRVAIFLSVLDVHVNRSPCDATVLATRYEDGEFLDARHPECGIRNQSNTIVLTDGSTPIAVVKQIVGAIARRIITPVSAGDRLRRGERFGMIAFGSRTELYVPQPDGWEVRVKQGQHVRGGIDILLAIKK